MKPWTLVVSTHRDEQVLEANLLRSPALAQAQQVIIKRGFKTVSAAYNSALGEASTDVVAFTHPDVYLPAPWVADLQRSLAWLDEHDPTWAVLGLVGSRTDGTVAGFTYSVGRGSFLGSPPSSPVRVRTVDEFVFVIRRSAGLAFDESLPGAQSQLCTPDICLDAERRGMSVYVVPAFALHNSNGWPYLPLSFWKPYLYIRRKWRLVLPIYVPYAKITPWCLPMIRNSVRAVRGSKRGHRSRSRVNDVELLYGSIRASIAGLFGLETTEAPAATDAKSGSSCVGAGVGGDRQ
jgi:hypothetical protein